MSYFAVGLHSPKTSNNIGAALRACGVFGAALLTVSGRRYKGSLTDVWKQHKHTPLIQCANLMGMTPYDCVPVGVDLVDGACPLPEYKHPERAYYIFGPEDGTLGHKVLDKCRDVIYIPSPGPCLNLAAAVSVVLYSRQTQLAY